MDTDFYRLTTPELKDARFFLMAKATLQDKVLRGVYLAVQPNITYIY